jgi:rSAM/selenodomain-associated transferase 1
MSDDLENGTPGNPYPVLDPAHPIEALKHLCALTVMAKAPRPGKVKTRLSPPLTLDQTAALNVRFLRDTTANLAGIAGSAGLISYTPVGDEALFAGLLPETFALIPQRGDAFGERLLGAAEDVLAVGYGSVCLIDSDSPTVPAAAFQQAVEALAQPGDRIVLGPSHDGGYYLIGMKQAHKEPFERISWSTGTVCAETMDRCRAAGLEVILLPTWYDVDDAATLAILTEELLNETVPAFATQPGYPAPHTRELLRAMQFDPLAVQSA